NNLKNEQVNLIFEATETLFSNFIFEVQGDLEEIPNFSFDKKIKVESIGINENSNWNSLLVKIGSAGGGIGGFLGGAAIAKISAVAAASAKAGAIIGVPAGPAGMAAAAVIGAAAGILGMFMLSKVGQ